MSQPDPRLTWKRTRRRILRYVHSRSSFSRCLVAGACATALHWGLYNTSFTRALDRLLLSEYITLNAGQRFPDDVLLVAIDRDSYLRENVSPLTVWPRRLLADVVERLAEYGVDRVIIDLVFHGEGDDPDGNRRLSTALTRVPSFIMAADYRSHGTDIDGAAVDAVTSVYPIDSIARSAVVLSSSVGYDDTVICRFYFDEHGAPPLAAILEPARRAAVPSPFDFIRYYGKPGSIRTDSAYQVLHDTKLERADRYRGKTVLVGFVGEPQPGITGRDTFLTPASAAVAYGVEIHGTIAANLLHGDWIRRAPPAIELGMLNIVTLLLISALARANLLRGGIVAFGGVAGFIVLGAVSYRMNFFLPGALLFLILAPLAFVINALWLTGRLKRGYAKIERAFGVRLKR